MDGTCSVAGCERQITSSKGFCGPHYARWKRNGDPGSPEIQRRKPGAVCAVVNCTRMLGKSGSHGYCAKHAYRFRSNGDPLVVRSPGASPGEANPNWRGDGVQYSAVHRRLRSERGRAREHACCSCGKQAQAWAYQHNSETEQICPKVSLPYTTDLSCYEPMCLPCHAQLDGRHGWPHPAYFGRGVSLSRSGRWRAYATFNGKQYAAGHHDTEAQAAVAAHHLRLRLLEDWMRAPA